MYKSVRFILRNNFIKNMSTTVEISAIRAKYREPQDIFHENSMTKKDPFHLFTKWFDEALVREDLVEPNAMCLATANKDGYPSARFVLLKTYDERGFTFFTNYDSRKAKDMEENPNVAATIYWLPLKRSIRIEGSVTKISKEESEVYFHSRPRASQIGALASPQSKAIPSREYLDEIESGIKKELGDGQVPIPNWGGYLITPRAIEFWQGQTNRLHDRIRFRKSDEKADEKLVHQADLEGWVYERLAP